MTELNLDNMTTGLAIELAPRRPPDRSDVDSGPSFQEHWRRTQAAAPASPPVERRASDDDSTTEHPVAERGVAEQADGTRKTKSKSSAGDSPRPEQSADAESAEAQEEPTEEQTADAGMTATNTADVASIGQYVAIEDIQLAPVDSAILSVATEAVPPAVKPGAEKPGVPLKPVAVDRTASNVPASATLPVDELSTESTAGEPRPVESDAALEGGQESETAAPVIKNLPRSEATGPDFALQTLSDRAALDGQPVVEEPTTRQQGRKPSTAQRQIEPVQAESPTSKAPPISDPSARSAPGQSAIDSIAATSVAAEGDSPSSHRQRTRTDGPIGGATDAAVTPRSTSPTFDQLPSTTEASVVGTSNSNTPVRADRRDAWNSGIHGGAGTESSRGLTDVERARLVQRVAGAFQTASERGTPIRLRLSPPELGSLRLEVAVRDGMMHARVDAESRQTQALLIDNLPALRERLAAQDIRLGAFDVGLMDSTAGGLPQRPQDQGVADQGPRFGGFREDANDAVPTSDIEPASLAATGRLNVVI